MEDCFSKTYSFGYDLSAVLHFKRLTFQFYHAAHKLNSSYTFGTGDVEDIAATDKKRISIPEEFKNMTYFTLSLGDNYMKRPSSAKEILYRLYITLRHDVPANKDLRPEFKIKYIDVITGFNLYYRNFLFNPEVLVHESNSIGMANYNCLGASLLAGYIIKSFSMKLGYSHYTCY